MRLRFPLLLGAAVLALAAWPRPASAAAIAVGPSERVDAILRTAVPGSTIRLLPGRHAPFEVATAAVTVEASPGATVRGPVEVSADGVRLEGLRVGGGKNGITVRDADDVTIQDVSVREVSLHGIEIVDSSAVVRRCRVGGLTGRFAQGLEVRNATSRDRTVVEGCTVSGGREGLLTHSARVEFRGNRVWGTTLRAIAISEMSEGIMEGNRVSGVRGAALYCGDMSHCEITGNSVSGVTPAPGGLRSERGHGVVGWYYSTLRVRGNDIRVPGDPVHLTLGSIETDRFPLAIWPAGWRGAIPATWVTAMSLAGLILIRWPAARWLRRRDATARGGRPVLGATAVAALVAAFAVQTFHMGEHGLQVFQTYVAEAQHRSGLLGAWLDTEWLHFGYNLVVLGFLAWLWWGIRPGGPLGVPLAVGAWGLAALLVQAYHVVEHTAKMLQHLSTGLDPAPGLLGGATGLVWFHFGINLAVYAGMAMPIVYLLLRRSSATEPAVPVAEASPA